MKFDELRLFNKLRASEIEGRRGIGKTATSLTRKRKVRNVQSTLTFSNSSIDILHGH